METIEGLELKITGGNRQILRGYIPQVSFSCNTAVYEGIHVGAVQLEAENIRINIGQVMKGKPLRLLEPVPVRGKLEVEEAALNTSLQSPLLSGGLTDLLTMFLQVGGANNWDNLLSAYHISWNYITLQGDKFTLTGTLRDKGGDTTPVTIRSGLSLVGGHHLRFHPIHIDGIIELGTFPDSLEVDLGEQVEIENLNECAAVPTPPWGVGKDSAGTSWVMPPKFPTTLWEPFRGFILTTYTQTAIVRVSDPTVLMPTSRITYRLYPSAESSRKMHLARKMHCELYNAALANRRTQYQRLGHSVDYFEQQNSLPACKKVWPEYKELGSHTLQATFKRVDFGYQRFFKGLSK